MFISTNTRRPAVTVAVNFGDISTGDVQGYIYNAVNIVNGRYSHTSAVLKTEIASIVAKGRSTGKDTKEWESAVS